MRKKIFINSLKIAIFIAIFLSLQPSFLKAISFMTDLEKAYTKIETVNYHELKHKDYFTMLFLGKDADEVIERSDSIIVLAINFQTKDSLLLSIPRDTYLPISCLDDKKDKITHAFSYGDNCTIKSLENALDIEFNYILEMDFTGFISIIDYFGTIPLNVPNLNNGNTWCEQDSNNQNNNVCFNQFGIQEVTSEQALALARTRKFDSDFSRGKRQLEIINSVIQKLSSMNMEELKNIDQLFLNLSGSVETNISLPSALRMAYDITTSDIDLTSGLIQIEGEDKIFRGENSTIHRYYFIPDETQLKEIRQQIAKITKKK